MKSPFEALIEDLAALQATRRPPTPDTASRIARHAAEAQRNRRMQQHRPLRKSAPLPEYKPDWEGLQARQDKIASDLEQTRIEQQKDAIREHLRTLRQAARAGRLSSFEAAKYDALVGQALRMGINP
mgnify:CR=1 FL=1